MSEQKEREIELKGKVFSYNLHYKSDGQSFIDHINSPISVNRVSYNLSSPNRLLGPCNLGDLEGWFVKELGQVSSEPERAILRSVEANLDTFVRWAKEAVLLWPGCNRVPDPDEIAKYHSFPAHIKQMARTARVPLDTRVNGPAIASFLLAGGDRPKRFGSSNAWSIHHLYSGKFPYHGRETTLHAKKDGNHFTQSAGLVAVHPIADALSDEFPSFAWLLRAKAYLKLGYDPDQVFSSQVDRFGFVEGRSCKVIVTPG